MKMGDYVAYEDGIFSRKFGGRGTIVDIKEMNNRNVYFIQNSKGIIFREESDICQCRPDYIFGGSELD